MSTITDGGPAFPMSYDNSLAYTYPSHQGMTLRDWFAGQVIPSVYTTAMREAEQGSGLFQDEHWRIGLAADAYALADAMLAAREVKP
jgi:hypothetical protein